MGIDPAASMPDLVAPGLSFPAQEPALTSPPPSSVSAASSPHSLSELSDTITDRAGEAGAKAAKGRGVPESRSSLASAKCRNKEDDWTRVKDPKEKKRIQNRVAQRSYRHRMKTRLESHEQGRFQHASGGLKDNTGCGVDQAQGMLAGGKPSSHISLLQNLYEPVAGDLDSPFFGHDVPYLNSPPNSHTSPQPAHDLLSTPPRDAAGRCLNVSQDFVLDCLRFQTQLLHRLNSLQRPEAGLFGPELRGTHGSVAPHDLGCSHNASCLGVFTPSHADGLNFGFDEAADAWKTGPLDLKVRHDALAVNGPAYACPPPPPPLAAASTTPMDSSAAAVAPSGGSLDECFDGFIRQVSAAGFRSFEDLVTAYYSESFAGTSALANEQHLSRNRRLPKVIADLFKDTSDWSAWERHGFHEEILKTAESILVSETSRVQENLASRVMPLVEAPDGAVSAQTFEVLLDVEKLIQQELPNSWALVMALATENRSLWQQDRSNTTVAIILLLRFAGRMPQQQLLQLISNYL